MNKILFNAIIALTVTILGGLVVYYLTLKPNKGESLSFWFDNPTVFAKDSSSLAIQRVIFSNTGDASASNVSLIIEYPKDVAIDDVTVVSSIGKNSSYKQVYVKGNTYKLECDKLMPKEKISLSYLLKSIHYQFKPNVFLKSSLSIGSYQDIQSSKQSDLVKFLFLIIPAQIFLILGLFLFKKYRFSSRSVNNTGFLFLHKDLPNYAKAIFEKAINDRGGDSLLISNYALVKAILEEYEDSIKLIEAALFYSWGGHEKAVCEFNYSIIYFLIGDKQNGRLKLIRALKHSKKAITGYINYSDLIKKIRLNTEVDSIFKELLTIILFILPIFIVESN
jgi:tetratricopeptide (TPR) repeat protein